MRAFSAGVGWLVNVFNVSLSAVSQLFEKIYLVDFRPKTALAYKVAGFRRGGYELRGGAFQSFRALVHAALDRHPRQLPDADQRGVCAPVGHPHRGMGQKVPHPAEPARRSDPHHETQPAARSVAVGRDDVRRLSTRKIVHRRLRLDRGRSARQLQARGDHARALPDTRLALERQAAGPHALRVPIQSYILIGSRNIRAIRAMLIAAVAMGIVAPASWKRDPGNLRRT